MSPISLATSDALWTVLAACCCSVACALPGCFLVLRRLSLLGDAISHAILPGIALAFILTGSRAALPMLLGATAFGVLTAGLVRLLHGTGDIPSDSAMGVVFTSLFAVGVLLITAFAGQIDLDPGCVLYGLLEFVALDVVSIGGLAIPRAMLTLVPALLLSILFVVLLWKELKISAFDERLAASMGLHPGLVHLLLMAMVSLVAVASFEAVGSVLVVAMLVVPGATAHLLTDRLSRMLWIAAVCAVLSSIGGYAGAVLLDTSVAGMIATCAGFQFALAALLAPKHGVLGRMLRDLSISLRIAREDALALLWRESVERGGPGLAPDRLGDLVGGGRRGARAVRAIVASGLAAPGDGGLLRPTPAGEAEAVRLVRAHRLWESYMTRFMDRPADEVHESAHRIEHFLEPALAERVAERLGDAELDPHGRAIPDPPDGAR